MPPILLQDNADPDEIDLPKLLLVGSFFYTGLNVMTYPLAVVKTRMQASAVQLSSREAARELLRVGGVGGFYAGLLPVLCGALPARAGYISALEFTRPQVTRACQSAGIGQTAAATVSNGAAGFAAVLASQVIYTPCDVVTQRIMVSGGASGPAAADASFWAVVRSIAQTSGWRGFYRGFGVTLIAYLPGGSVWWGAYGGARAAAAELRSSDKAWLQVPPLAEQFLAATWASLWTVTVTSPLDVLKTRTQLSPAAVPPPLLETARHLVKSEGLMGLYRGFLPRWCQATVFTGSVISLYEHLKHICRKPTK